MFVRPSHEKSNVNRFFSFSTKRNVHTHEIRTLSSLRIFSVVWTIDIAFFFVVSAEARQKEHIPACAADAAVGNGYDGSISIVADEIGEENDHDSADGFDSDSSDDEMVCVALFAGHEKTSFFFKTDQCQSYDECDERNGGMQ